MGEIAEDSAVAAAPAVRASMPVIVAGVALTAAVIAMLEYSRRAGIAVPVPFLLLYISVVLAAVITGIRGGLVAATLASGFVIYCANIGYGPDNLTGGALQVAAGVGLAFFAGGFLGYTRDSKLRLIAALRQREALLEDARRELARQVEQRGDELAGLTTEFSRLRNQMSSATRHSPAGVVVIDAQRQVESANDAALRMFSIDSEEDSRVDLDEFLATREIWIDGRRAGGDDYGPLKKAVREGIVVDSVDMRVVQPDGTIRWIRGSFAPIRNELGGIDGATAILIDVTDKMKTRFKLEELSRRLLHVQEAERSYIARELHDEIGQHLTGIKMFLHSAARQIEDPDLLDESIDRIDQLMTTVRNLAVEFRPSVLDDLGLEAALRWYIDRQQAPEGCSITLDTEASDESLSAGAITAAFRIVQEGISNALRHAGASTIAIRLYNVGTQFGIDISDDGRGFDRDNAGHKGGFGLMFMQERVRELDGTLTIDTSPGRGTKISACFPANASA